MVTVWVHNPQFLHFAAIPVTAHIDQNVVGLRLTIETRARRPKRRVPPFLTAKAEDLNDVVGRSRHQRENTQKRTETPQATKGNVWVGKMNEMFPLVHRWR
jgi:hypothetical protein